MAKKSKAVEWNSFTKAELIRTIKKLTARETKLLNEIATLKAQLHDHSDGIAGESKYVHKPEHVQAYGRMSRVTAAEADEQHAPLSPRPTDWQRMPWDKTE